ncbi:MAG: VWA domain-containing protein [Chthoniobacterales bacterium]
MKLPDVSGFAFAHPWVLFLLLLIPVLALLRGRLGGNPGIVFSSVGTLAEIGSRRRSRAGNFLAALSYLGLALLIVGLARPQFGRTITHTQASGVDIMLLLDVSGSMLSEDFTIGSSRANRIDAVKQVTQKFIESRPNDRIGIIAFAGRPYIVSPPTLDHDWLITNLDRVQVGLVEDGTAIGSAIAVGANRLKNKDAKTRLMVLLTDGANNAGKVSPTTAAEAARALGIRIYTIGAGTRGPVPYPVVDPFGQKRYQLLETMDADDDTLSKIAKETNGQFFRATDIHSLENIFKDIDKLEKTKIEFQKIAEYRDLFPGFLLAGLILLILEIILSQTVWRKLP